MAIGAGLLLSCCSLFKARIPPYPTGLLFPIEESFSVGYGGEIISFIQRSGGILYFSTRNGYIFCLDGPGKKILWKFKAQAEFFVAPSLGDKALSINDSANTLYRLDFQGRLLWQKSFEDRITSRLKEYQGVIYLGTEKGDVMALDSSRGAEIWRFKAGGPISSGPAFWGSQIIFGCEDGKLYFISSSGKPVGSFNVGARVEVSPVVDENRLYFGSMARFFYCLDLNNRKPKWKTKISGRASVEAVVWEKRLFFLTSNNVLYSLNKRSGEVLWWQALPSHSVYNLEFAGDKIVAASFSSELACFDLKNGKKSGDYEAPGELKSNALWLDPYLLINLYDSIKQEGELIYLAKQIKVSLNTSKISPQKMGDDMTLTASPAGFFRPKFEFYVKAGGQSEVIQKESEKDSCVWFPQKEGTYLVGVRVKDEKEKAEAEIPFVIEKKEEPKKKDQEIK